MNIEKLIKKLKRCGVKLHYNDKWLDAAELVVIEKYEGTKKVNKEIVLELREQELESMPEKDNTSR